MYSGSIRAEKSFHSALLHSRFHRPHLNVAIALSPAHVRIVDLELSRIKECQGIEST